MNKVLNITILMASLVLASTITLAATPDGLGPWADEVIEFNQGLRDDGSAVAADRSDPLEALGIAEEDDTYNPLDVNFVALGYGGTLTLKFENTIENLEGDDLRIVETTYGSSTCENYPEKATIEVSSDGTNWVTVQGDPVCHNGFFDLGDYDLECIQYVRITDVTNPNDFNVGHITDAYDVDGVESLHSSTLGSCRELEEPGTGDFKTIGFWKHQFGGKGKKHLSQGELYDLLWSLDPPYDSIDDVQKAEKVLWLKKASMEERAFQQCFATMLNYANGAVKSWEMVDTDYDGTPDMTFEDAMDDFLEGTDYENNKNLCDSINNMNHN